MITSVDTSILLDVFVSNAPHHSQSQERLIGAYDRGAILVCDVVYAELVPAFGDRSALDGALRQINATVSPLDTTIAYEAGLRWSRYRQAGGPRTRIMSDFLIGAHAVASADTFLTRDRGFYATYFPELQGR
ncbi:MAG: type II toxin-antitoxin system VapC family toxin [Caldilineaceae bacterium]|nr:type II toxin-antitoxin system VapC family toxin [Caldilineaceae bacterium]